jgi:hypothetical protein
LSLLKRGDKEIRIYAGGVPIMIDCDDVDEDGYEEAQSVANFIADKSDEYMDWRKANKRKRK